jgi:hypothetical protein
MEDYEWSRRDLEDVPGYDPSYEIVYHASWSDYEEHGYIYILRRDSQLYSLENGHSVMAEDNSERWDLYPINEDQALTLMIEWDETEYSYNQSVF